MWISKTINNYILPSHTKSIKKLLVAAVKIWMSKDCAMKWGSEIHRGSENWCKQRTV